MARELAERTVNAATTYRHWRGISARDNERCRLDAICEDIPHSASVLDVGCGDCALLDALNRHSFEGEYLGIDYDAEAIAAAQARHPEGRVVRADLETFTTGVAWDVVDLAEVLYYLRDPIGQLERYRQFAAPGGKVIVSMYPNPKRARLKRALAALIDWRYPIHARECVRRMDRHLCHSRNVSMRMVAIWRLWVLGA